jgi:hypothetical protein
MDKFKPPSNFSPLAPSSSAFVTLLPEIFKAPNNLFLSDTFQFNIFKFVPAIENLLFLKCTKEKDPREKISFVFHMHRFGHLYQNIYLA